MKGGVSIIGSGNVATSLAVAFENAGMVLNEIYSQDPANALKLVGRLYQASAVDSLDFRESQSRLIIIAVRDDAVQEVAENLWVEDTAIVAHTSGTLSIEILKNQFTGCGVFYPLQTFTREKIMKFDQIPLLIEGSDRRIEKELSKTASKISNEVVITDSEAREEIHLAAVFASNFSNHMIGIAYEILEESGIEPSILSPLIRETIDKSLSHGPEASQTGPARRADIEILNHHLKKLKEHPELGSIYKKISEHILKKFS